MAHDASFFDMVNALWSYEVPENVLAQPGGHAVKFVVLLWLTRQNSRTGFAYPGVETVSRRFHIGQHTVRSALRLACELGLMKVEAEPIGRAKRYSFPVLEQKAREPKAAKVKVKAVATPAPAPQAAVQDDTGIEPPALDPSLPDFDWAEAIAKDLRFYHVKDGVRSATKQIVYALQHGATKDGIIAAIKANGKRKVLENSWDVLAPLVQKPGHDDLAEARKKGPPPSNKPAEWYER